MKRRGEEAFLDDHGTVVISTPAPIDPLTSVARGDLILVNPSYSTDAKGSYSHWDNRWEKRKESKYAIYIARVDDDIVIEYADSTRKLVPYYHMKELVFKKPAAAMSVTTGTFTVDTGPR